MATVPSPRPSEPGPAGGEHSGEYQRLRLPPEQRRLIRFIVILALVALAWAALAIAVVVS